RRRVITVSRTHSRSSAVLRDDELRLPRPPGIIRQFWARHPRFADILIALICLLLSVGASAAPGSRTVPVTPWAAALVGVAIVATAVLLVWRRRRPVAVLVAAILLDVLLLLVTHSSGGPAFAVAGYTLAVHRATRASWIGLGTGVVITGGFALAWWGVGGLSLQAAVNTLLSVSIPGLIGTLIGINTGNSKRYLEAIIGRSRQLLVERDQQA